MACRLFGAKLLPKLMLPYSQLHPKDQNSMKYESKYNTFHGNAFENIVSEMAAILYRPQYVKTCFTMQEYNYQSYTKFNVWYFRRKLIGHDLYLSNGILFVT